MSPAVVGTLVPPVQPTAPASPVRGQMYYDSTQNILYFWNGTQWVSTQSTSGTIYDSDQVGVVKSFSGTTIPTNWMLADGRALLRSSYPDLFAAITFNGTATATSGSPTLTAVAAGLLTQLQATGAPTSGISIPVDGANIPAGARITGYNVGGGTVTLSANASGSGATTAYVSPWGNGDGSSTFNLPDLRSRFLIGANYQGAPALGNDAQITGGAQALVSRILASIGGEQSHLLVAAEGAQNGNATTIATNTGYADTNHYHVFNVNSGNESAYHYHAQGGPNQNNVPVTQSGPSGAAVMGGTPPNTGNQSAFHYHNINSNTDWQSNSYNNSNHYHAQNAQNINARNADNAHSTMPPWCAVALIIKVAGTQINSGGAIQGATGQRGSNWSMYTGAGTPAAGTFVNELDGDWCFRQSDGEVFRRVSGAWVDQGFTQRTTAPISTCRGTRAAALALTANTWTKIPLDTVTFDTAGMLSTAQGRINIQTAGYYQVNGVVFMSVSATGTYTAAISSVYKNGAQGPSAYNYAAIQTYADAVISDVIYCVPGDYLELYCYNGQSGSSVYTSPSYTFLSVALITAGPGPQGARGSNWYTYTGAGTPPAGSFLNEADGDMAVRTSDGEVFKRISGTWTDQGWTQQLGSNTMDTWHLIGQSGQPAFGSGVTNYGAPFNVGGFRKFPDGKVKFKGLLNVPASATVFTLPVGYRPVAQVLTMTECQAGPARWDITTAGVVTCNAAAGWASMESIEFDTESVSVMSAGAQGPRGAGWYSYTGSGTPAANAIPNTQNGDFCIRASDGEVFQMVGGAWTDQGYAIKGSGGGGGGGGGTATAVATRMYRSAAWTSPGVGYNKLPLDAISYDTSNMASTANGRIQVPAGGYYQVNAGVQINPTTTDNIIIGLYVNGTERVRGNRQDRNVGGTAGVSVSDVLSLSAGDYIEVWVYTNAADALQSPQGSSMDFLSVSQVASANLTTAPVTPVRAYRSAAFQVTAAGVTKVPLDAVQFDPGGNFSVTNGRYTVPATGQYAISCRVIASGPAASTDTALEPCIYVNGAQRSSGTGAARVDNGGYVRLSHTDILSLNAGDYVELYIWSGGGTWNLYVNQQGEANSLSISQVGNVSSVSAPTSTMCARMHRTAALTTGAGWTKIPLDTTTYDTSGMAQLVNGRLVAQVAGYYQVNGCVSLVVGATAQDTLGTIYVNGADTLRGGRKTTVSYSENPITGVLRLNAGDYVELYAYTGVALALDVAVPSSSNYLDLTLISSLPGMVGPVTPARAYRSAALTTAASAFTKIPLDTISFDPGSNFSLATGRYTAPATGYYQVNGTCAVAASASDVVIASIYVNGTERVRGSRVKPNQDWTSLEVNDVISCNAGDYLELWVYTGVADAGATGTVGTSSLSVSQVGNLSSVSAPTSTMCARMYRNAAFTPGINAWVKVPLDAVTFDTSGMASTANGRIQISQAGYYQVDANLVLPTGSGTVDLEIAIFKNGTVYSTGSSSSYPGAGNKVQYADVIQCSAGDYLELNVYTNVANPLSVGTGSNYLSVALLTSLPGAVGATTPARAYRNAALGSLVSATGTKVPLDTISYDPGGNFNLATQRYTCPATGYYQVNGNVTYNIGSTAMLCAAAIAKNGAIVAIDYTTSNPTASSEHAVEVADVVSCNAGDYLELWYYVSAGGAALYVSPQQNCLSVVQVGNQMATPASTATARMSSGAWSVTTSYTKVPLNTVSFDTSGITQPASNRIVAPVAGYYKVDVVAMAGSCPVGNALLLALYKNGASYGQLAETHFGNASYYLQAAASDVIQLNAGDYIELWAYCTTATNGQSAFLTMTLLTPLSGTAGPVSTARAYRNAAYTLPGTSWQKIPIDKIDFDPASNMSTSTGRYTAPATGYYQVNGEVALGPTTGNISVMVHAAIYVNGVYARTGSVVSDSDNQGYMRASVSDILSLNAGDYVELWTYSLTAYALLVGPSYNYLSVSQVGNSMNFKAASGDLTGNYPSPTLATGAASRNIGTLGGDLQGTLPNPILKGTQRFDIVGGTGTLCTFIGLNGNADLTYEVILDFLLYNWTANPYFYLLPNGAVQGLGTVIEQRVFTSDATNSTTDMLISTPSAGSYPFKGFFAGHGDWNTGGRMNSKIRISAACITNPTVGTNQQGTVGRGSWHEGVYMPNAAGSNNNYSMGWRGSTNWYDGSTNITSLALVVYGGGNVSGRATLRVVS